MKTFGKTLAGLGAALFTMLVAASAFAQEAAGATAFNDRDKWIAAASALGVGIAAFGGALGQGRAAFGRRDDGFEHESHDHDDEESGEDARGIERIR